MLDRVFTFRAASGLLGAASVGASIRRPRANHLCKGHYSAEFQLATLATVYSQEMADSSFNDDFTIDIVGIVTVPPEFFLICKKYN